MPTYTTSAKVLTLLPDSPPSGVTTNTTQDIADASAVIESLVGDQYALSYNTSSQKFPDVGDTPATPAIIELAARYYAAHLQLLRLKMLQTVDEGEEDSLGNAYRRKAEELAEGVRSGQHHVTVSESGLRSTTGDYVTDEIYEDNEDEPFLTNDAIDAHQY
jgi:hypothetical protein